MFVIIIQRRQIVFLTAFKTNGPVNVSSKTKLIKWNSFCPFGAELGEAISGRAELLCHYAQFVSGNLAFCPSDIQNTETGCSKLGPSQKRSLQRCSGIPWCCSHCSPIIAQVEIVIVQEITENPPSHSTNWELILSFTKSVMWEFADGWLWKLNCCLYGCSKPKQYSNESCK